MMGRENCNMCSIHMDKVFCDYYDAFCRECSEEVDVCPDGLDDDEELDDNGEPDEDEINEYLKTKE